MQAYNPSWLSTTAGYTEQKTVTQDDPPKLNAILFAEGEGYILMKTFTITNYSKMAVVRSLADNKLYVRKESLPNIEDPQLHIQNVDVRPVKMLQSKGVRGIPDLIGWIEYETSNQK